MARSEPVPLTIVVEGDLDEAVVRRIAQSVGLEVGRVHGRVGKPYIRDKIAGFAGAARGSPWLVVCDLDRDKPCASALVADWLGERVLPAEFRFRVCVRAVEAWLLADRNAFARFVGVTPRRLPARPDESPDPKRDVVSLASGSSSASIRTDLCPSDRSGRVVGPGYTSRLVRFVQTTWDPGRAAAHSDSLARCIRSLETLGGRVRD